MSIWRSSAVGFFNDDATYTVAVSSYGIPCLLYLLRLAPVSGGMVGHAEQAEGGAVR